MARFETKHRVQHSAENMFALVADVEQYPQFVPLCQSTAVRGRKDLGDGSEMIVADMTVAYKLVRETFTSRAHFDRPKMEINVSYLDGPFHHLDNRWRFDPVDDATCDVHFYIDYEFRSRLLGSLMGTMFGLVFGKFSEAFEKRADQIYGKGDVLVKS
ncbi:MAG: ubiquinone-binding protein [Hyphomicrobiales bacterium]|nr:MAG: ubiquinone-binding protein [Hyphomicrobiales bacterium]